MSADISIQQVNDHSTKLSWKDFSISSVFVNQVSVPMMTSG
jgi:hypothetical protein